MHLEDGNRSVRALPPTRFYARRRRARLRSVKAKSAQLDPPRVAKLTQPPHGLLDIRRLQQSEGDAGLDSVELPTAGAAHPAPDNVQA